VINRWLGVGFDQIFHRLAASAAATACAQRGGNGGSAVMSLGDSVNDLAIGNALANTNVHVDGK